MPLPKLKNPTHTMTLPSTGKKITYRPFLAKEEKILLMAKEANDKGSQLQAVKQIISNCVIDEIDVDSLATFDVEMLFLKIYSKSVSNIINVRFADDTDKSVFHDVEIDLEEVEVTEHPDHTPIIKLDETYSIKMKYPALDVSADKADSSVEMIAASIEYILEGEEIYKADDYSFSEMVEFVESFSANNLRQVARFFETMPGISVTVQYQNSVGETSTREIRGLHNFFTS